MKLQYRIMAIILLSVAAAFTACEKDDSGSNDKSYSYTVTFDSQGADTAANPAEKTVASPATAIDALPSVPVKAGYTFAGWWTETNGTGTEFTVGTSVTGDITLFASWTRNPVYTVTFNSDGGTAAGEQHVTLPATTVGALPTSPARTGYLFGGWYTGTDGSGTEFTASTTVMESITVYACWNTYIYTVTFDIRRASTTEKQ